MQYQSYWRVSDDHFVMRQVILHASDGAAYFSSHDYGRGPGEAELGEQLQRVVGRHAMNALPRWSSAQTEESTRSGPAAAREMVERYLAAAARLQQEATPMFQGDSVVLTGDEDVARMRPKTPSESIIDEIALWTALHAEDRAEAFILKHGLHGAGTPTTMFWDSLAAQMIDSGARESGKAEDIETARQATPYWTTRLFTKYGELAASERYPAQHVGYYFGNGYKTAGNQVVAAGFVLARQALEAEHNAAAALQIIEFGETTNYGTNELTRLHLRTLLTLNRRGEAVALHARWQHALGEMPELAQAPDLATGAVPQQKE